MNCPRCAPETRLAADEYEGAAIDRCPRCGGAWFDAGELRRIVFHRRVRFEAADRHATRRRLPPSVRRLPPVDRGLICPRCGQRLAPMNFAADLGVAIDRCPNCSGHWLDATELETIQMLVEAWEEGVVNPDRPGSEKGPGKLNG